MLSVRLLVLTCTLSPDVSSATITIRSQDDYQRLLQSGEQSVRSLLSVARERGCNVLLSSVTQHPSTLQLCSQLSITVIQQLSDTEVQRVCRLTGAVPVSSPHEAATATLGRASLLRLLQLGNRVCVQLDMDGGVHVDYKPHTLVLAAASDGIAKQYQQAVMRAFSLLAHFTSLSSNSAAAPFLLPGAGATEFQLSIRCTARYGPTVPSSVGWRVMAAALLAVPRALYAAACSEDDVTYARFIEVETVVRAQVRRERSSVGIGQPNKTFGTIYLAADKRISHTEALTETVALLYRSAHPTRAVRCGQCDRLAATTRRHQLPYTATAAIPSSASTPLSVLAPLRRCGRLSSSEAQRDRVRAVVATYSAACGRLYTSTYETATGG